MCPSTTFARCPAGPDEGGPWSARCIRKPPLPGATQSRIKVDHGVGVSSTRLGNTICGTQFVPECSRICSRGLASGTKNVPDNALEHLGFVCFCGFGNIFVPDQSPRVPDFVPDSSPLEQKMFPIAGAPRAGSRWTTECEMFPATPLHLCPIGLDQGGPRIAICIWQRPLAPAP